MSHERAEDSSWGSEHPGMAALGELLLVDHARAEGASNASMSVAPTEKNSERPKVEKFLL